MADAAPMDPLSSDEEACSGPSAGSSRSCLEAADADMLEELPISRTEYTVLVHLSVVPHHQMRMSEPATVCGLSLSGMTRVVNRLESQSLGMRQKCPVDGRAWFAVLTDPGRKMLEEAWPTNLASAPPHLPATGRLQRRCGG